MPIITKGKNNWKIIIILVVLAIFVGAELLAYISNFNSDMTFLSFFLDEKKPDKKIGDKVACTEEAKICPDGSLVGRTGPNCEFAACPEANTTDWKKYSNKEYGFEIKYPSDFIEQKIESDKILLSIAKEQSHYFEIMVIKKYDINQIKSTIKEVKEVSVGGHLGYEYFYVEGAGASEVLLIQAGQDALSISLDYIDDKTFSKADDKKAYVQNTFNQMISTFKFI